MMPCTISCLRKPPDVSSEDEDTFYDLETKSMILKEIRRRAMRPSSKSNDFFYSNNLTMSFLPSINNNKNNEEDLEETLDNEDESEAFFSVRSNFSQSSQAATGSWEENKVYHSVLEEFKQCEGWPFGLCRRAVVRLPPLPSIPADSWMWRKRNDVAAKANCYSPN